MGKPVTKTTLELFVARTSRKLTTELPLIVVTLPVSNALSRVIAVGALTARFTMTCPVEPAEAVT